ncbi:hypothetical protein B0H34DRAFT_66673 [Crassisporium funariophilum]|nr:hypothetical protein B0H34DRAFT_66673 [Crassisporium funariophilum]
MKYEADACVEYTEYIDDKLTPVKRPCFEMQSELVRGIHDLEEFSGLLSKFVAWWNLMSMESTTQMTRGSSVIARFDSLRMLSIEKKWKDHRKRYATYVDEIVLVQDHYPKLFAHSRSITFEGDEPFSPPPNQPPSYSRRQDQSQGTDDRKSYQEGQPRVTRVMSFSARTCRRPLIYRLQWARSKSWRKRNAFSCYTFNAIPHLPVDSILWL